jgi:hypothetical protein
MRSRNFQFSKAMAGAVAATACAALTLTAVPAEAVTQPSAVSAFRAPSTKIGPVTGLALDVTKPGDSYRVHVSWHTLSGATAYKVSFSVGGTTVSRSPKIKETEWAATVPALTVSNSVTARVVPYAGKRPGRAASISASAPDVTAPTGTYTVDLQGDLLTARVTETALSDDATPRDDIVREIAWDRGADFVAWPVGTTTIDHKYDAGPNVYHPQVRLTDAATPVANSVVVELDPVVIEDALPPGVTGSFTVSPTGPFANYTRVTITQDGVLTDDASNPEDIARTVDWKDGTSSAWTTGTTTSHVYRSGGIFTPTVTLTDESQKSTSYEAGQVTVSVDSVKPTVRLVRPAKRIRPEVSSWVRLHGKAADSAGTGVRVVKLRLVEKRGGAWFGYKATTKTWVKAATKAGALNKSRSAAVKPLDGAWRYRVRGLAKGLLLVKVYAKDNVGNVSTAKVYKQLLTRR